MSAGQVSRGLEDVLFMPNASAPGKIEELLASTPEILAETDKLMFHVSSSAEAYSSFEETLPKRIPEAMPA
jgi:hypothetical protein